jgi:hypothetical protein
MEAQLIQKAADLVSQYGYPMVAVCGIAYIIFFIWHWVVNQVEPLLDEADESLVALIDRIRMLDHDLIRLNEKVRVVLYLRGKVIDRERRESELELNTDTKES